MALAASLIDRIASAAAMALGSAVMAGAGVVFAGALRQRAGPLP